MGFGIASEPSFFALCDSGVCDMTHIAHLGGFAPFGPLRARGTIHCKKNCAEFGVCFFAGPDHRREAFVVAKIYLAEVQRQILEIT